MTSSPPTLPPLLVAFEPALWSPGPEWDAALDHLASRFRRVAELDVDAVRSSDGLATQLDAIDAWVATCGASIDIETELARYFDQHLSMHLRPDAAHTRALRAAASSHDLHSMSALPEAVARSIARHAGLLRSLSTITGSVRSDAARDAVRASIGADRIVTSLDELSPAAPSL